MMNKLLEYYGIKNPTLVSELLTKYMNFVLEKNKQINLTAITDKEQFIIKHIADSLSIIPYVREEINRTNNLVRAIDIGTGAGFPGMIVKICEMGIFITLLDSIKKKCSVIEEAKDILGISMVEVLCARAEELAKKSQYREQYDIAFARAVARLNELCEYVLPFLKIGGLFIAQKGFECDDEIDEAKKAVIELGCEIEKVEKIILPFGEEKRSIILIRKYRQTSIKYPRNTKQIIKNPIK